MTRLCKTNGNSVQIEEFRNVKQALWAGLDLEKLNFACVQKTYCFFQNENKFYQVKEHFEEGSLSDILARVGKMQDNEALIILKQLTWNLKHLLDNKVKVVQIERNIYNCQCKENANFLSFLHAFEQGRSAQAERLLSKLTALRNEISLKEGIANRASTVLMLF